ncbi:MAG TPA: hypothetical protein VGO93_09715 [Candidatus Xenobia bacterium]
MNLASRGLATMVMLGASLAPSLYAPAQAATQPEMVTVVPSEHYDGPAQLIDGMMKGQISPADQAQIQQHLQRIDPDVLKTVAHNGTKIVVLKSGQTPYDLGLKHVDTDDRDLSKPDVQAMYRQAADTALARTDAQYGQEIHGLESQIEARQAQIRQDFKPAPSSGGGMLGLASVMNSAEGQMAMDPQLQGLQDRLGTVEGKSFGQAWDQMMKTNGTHVEPYTPPQTGNVLADAQMAAQPVSLEDIAWQHGARTPAERQQFVSQLEGLNGKRVDTLQQQFVQDPESHFTGQAYEKLPSAQRPFHPDEHLLVPNYYFYRNNPDHATEKPQIMNHEDYDSETEWKSGQIVGEYYQDFNTIVYQSGHLDKNDEGSDTPQHEVGHAYKAALKAKDPSFYQTWETKWKAHYDDKSQPKRFPTEYAAWSEEEYYAEDFSAWFSGRQAVVTGPDQTGATLMQQSLAEAHKLAH